MGNPAFIVEGHQERRIIERLCYNYNGPIPTVTNGDEDELLEIIANEIVEHIISFDNRHYPIFVILDREKKSKSSDEIISEISKIITDKGISDKIIFGVPDRDLESWILPFINDEGAFTKEAISGFEGEECKKQLKCKVNKGRKNNNHNFGRYRETGSGVEIFVKHVKPDELVKVSKSFKKFYDQAKEDCPWLKNYMKD